MYSYLKEIKKLIPAMFIISMVMYGCSQKSQNLKIGFGKANLTEAGIYDDPIVESNGYDSSDKYSREEKFAISDRVEGRWRPGSGRVRKIADSIFVSTMYGEDKNGSWAIITIDETLFHYKTIDDLREPLVNKLGIAKERLVFLPSHGHATPAFDFEKLKESVFNAVKQAKDNMSEVEVASLNVELDGKKYSINRRVHVAGIGSRTVMFNDGCVIHDDYVDATDHITEWVNNLGVDPKKYLKPDERFVTTGNVDNNLQAIFIRDKKSKELKGSFLRFASHAVIVSAKVVNGDVSADYPGHLKRRIENELGGIALFGQGTCGDLRPLNKTYSHEFAKQYGDRLAFELIKRFDTVEWQPLTKLKFYCEPFSLTLQDNIFYSDEELKVEMDKVEELFDKETNPQERRKLQNKFWGLYRTPWVHDMVRPEWKETKHLDLNNFALQLNDKVIVAIQGEVFNQIGKDMIEPFKDKNPVLVSIINEYVSYIPTDEERPKGGYEPSVSIVVPGSPDIMIKSVHNLLGKIYNNVD